MDRRQINNLQLKRERVAYDYLESLEHGDIDGIIESLQQAIYDAPLEQMLVDAHQAYFQDEQTHKAALVETDTREMPTLEPSTLRSRGSVQRRRGEARQRVRWIQVLAAVLILGVLVGSFITVLALRQQGQQGQHGKLTQQSACQAYPLKQFDAQNNVPTAASINQLNSVTAIAPNDAWAVGYSSSASTLQPNAPAQSISESTFIEHWDGKSWQMVASPNKAENNILTDVAAVSSNDVWAIGSSWNSPASSNGPVVVPVYETLIEHWDGKSWQMVPGPDGDLRSLAAVSKNDIWAVGSSEDGHPLIEHWDGERWQPAALPANDASTLGKWNDIIATSADDIWAVGQGHSDNEQQQYGLITHWNGSQWQSEPAPTGSVALNSVSALSTHDLWVVSLENAALRIPQIEHWDGQQWRSIALPHPLADNPQANLAGIDVASADNVWAVSSVPVAGTPEESHALLLHWNGQSWQQVSVPALQPPNLVDSDASGIAVSGGQIWIVGDATTGDSEGGSDSALILGQRSCP